jgi:hypothetical protein
VFTTKMSDQAAFITKISDRLDEGEMR